PAKCFGRQCWLARRKDTLREAAPTPRRFYSASILALPISMKISDVELTRARRCRRTVSVCTFKARKARTLRLLCTYPNAYGRLPDVAERNPRNRPRHAARL